MSELISNLNTIESCKLDIKSAIEAKGVSMSGVSFPDYATAIGSITTQFVTESLSVSQNGTYTPGQGVDGFSQVSVNVPQSVTGYTLKQCVERSYLSSIIDDSTITYVAPYALANTGITGQIIYFYPMLTSVNLINCSLVGSYAFRSCISLTTVNLPVCIEIDEQAFRGCGLVSISIPVCSYMKDSCFAYCDYLESINLPALEATPGYCFYRCIALSKVFLSVCSVLYQDCFTYCSNLREITLMSTSVCKISILRGTIFGYTPIASGTGSIYVPASLVSDYQAAAYWSSYASQIYSIPE